MCETHRLNNLLDILFQQYTKYANSYINDTKDSLQKLPADIYENSILVKFNVENLYSNIPLVLGLETIAYWIKGIIERTTVYILLP